MDVNKFINLFRGDDYSEPAPTFSDLLENCHANSLHVSEKWLEIGRTKNVVYGFVDTETGDYIYIGKTSGEFRNRLYQHLNQSNSDTLRNCLATRKKHIAVEVYVTDSRRDTTFLEAYLIWRYQPEGNTEGVKERKRYAGKPRVSNETLTAVFTDIDAGLSNNATAKKHGIGVATLYRYLSKRDAGNLTF